MLKLTFCVGKKEESHHGCQRDELVDELLPLSMFFGILYKVPIE